jgi:methanethiol S-methyltransferase
MKKTLILLFGIICYVIFFLTFLYSIGFVGNVFVPKTIDSGVGESMTFAIIYNVVLLSIFAIQHSVMARPAFKKWLTSFFSPAIERSIYVLLSSGALLLIFWKWQPMTNEVWNIENTMFVAIIEIIFWVGWIIVLISTFLINHFHLFGLLQVYDNFKNQTLSNPVFKKNLFYKTVRHPIMLGFIIAFWATPIMTYGHLLFAVVTTCYIFIAVKFLEEKDLVEMHGDVYREYQKNTPMIFPFTKF